MAYLGNALIAGEQAHIAARQYSASPIDWDRARQQAINNENATALACTSSGGNWISNPNAPGGQCSRPSTSASTTPSANITVNPAINTQVNPQVSPTFQQQYQPSNSPATAGTTQQSASGGLTAADVAAMLREQATQTERRTAEILAANAAVQTAREAQLKAEAEKAARDAAFAAAQKGTGVDAPVTADEITGYTVKTSPDTVATVKPAGDDKRMFYMTAAGVIIAFYALISDKKGK